MIIRAEDFSNKNVFMMIIEEAQAKGIIKQGPISWDEESVVDLYEFEIEVVPVLNVLPKKEESKAKPTMTIEFKDESSLTKFEQAFESENFAFKAGKTDNTVVVFFDDLTQRYQFKIWMKSKSFDCKIFDGMSVEVKG
jgi:hypothetical protein